MAIEELLIRMSEIVHLIVERNKAAIISNSNHKSITISQLYYLEAVYLLGQPTLSHLAAHLKVTKASTSIALQKLIRQGLVEQLRASDDKRSTRIKLTAAGSELIKAEIKSFSDLAVFIQETITAGEVRKLESILEKIIEKYQNG